MAFNLSIMKLSFKIGLRTVLAAGGIAICISAYYSYLEGRARQLELKTHANTIADMMGLTFQEALINQNIKTLDKYLTNINARKDLAYGSIRQHVCPAGQHRRPRC
jgi:hypothetical protein